MSISTIILSLLITVCVVLAVRRLVKKGMCDCHDGDCEGCSGCAHKGSKGSECKVCSAAERMVASIENKLHP